MNFPLLSAQEAARLIKDKEVLGIGGFSSVGTPKLVPMALAEYARKLHSEGKEFKVGLITGGAAGSGGCGVYAYTVPVRQGYAKQHQQRESGVFRPAPVSHRSGREVWFLA